MTHAVRWMSQTLGVAGALIGLEEVHKSSRNAPPAIKPLLLAAGAMAGAMPIVRMIAVPHKIADVYQEKVYRGK